MSLNVPLSTLRMFEAAARFESFQDAATELNVSPSAVSQQVGNLEKRLGTPLFNREYRRVTLTATGRELGRSLTKGFRIIETALIAADPSSYSGPVRCAVYQTFASRWLIPRLQTLGGALAEVSIELETGMHSDKFIQNSCDLAIIVGKEPIEGLKATRLMDEVLVPACAPSVAKQLECVDDLLTQTLIQSSNRTKDWDLWLANIGLKRPDATRQLVFSNSTLAYEAAVAEAGVVIAQQQFLDGFLAARQLVVPFDIPVPTRRSYFLMEPAGKTSRPSVRLVRDWLLTEAAQARTSKDLSSVQIR